MTDRYRGYAPVGRSATFNPARASMPNGIGYSSLYAGDTHILPSSSSSSSSRQQMTTPRAYWTTTTSGGPTTTRTYAVTHDPRSRHGGRDHSRTRRSTLDSAPRPPVIITTTQKDRPHAAASSSHSTTARAGSPVRDDYRSSDGHLYTQPASSIRSRSAVRSHNATTDDEEYARLRERGDSLMAADAYRNSRPSVLYPSDARETRHAPAAIEFGDDGYQYTNAGELLKYDLDHSRPTRARRRESLDRGYYRPNVNYNADQRSLNVNTSQDLSRNYNMNTSRPYEGGRSGPPPSTRGFDKINRAYDAPRDLPPAAPVPPAPTTAAQADTPGVALDRYEGRRSRPVSLYQDSPPRSLHHEEYYRTREDERNLREVRDRDRESERTYEASQQFRDDNVVTRGFGIRADLLDRDDGRRRDTRRDDPKKLSDESLPRPVDADRDDRRGARLENKDERRERRESRRGSDEDEKERSRFRDKVASGLGVAAAAVGLAPLVKDADKDDKDSPRRRRSPEEDKDRRRDADDVDRSKVIEREKDRTSPRDDSELRDRHRRDAEARLAGEAVASASDSDENRRQGRRHRASNSFNPNDPDGLKQLQEELASLNASEKGKGREVVAAEDMKKSRSSSLSRAYRPSESPKDEIRGRQPGGSASEDKQVRLVSPPRDKSREKPLKGILKQPKVSFPEEPNPIREGVAPHKEDKKVKEAPAGAKWTKISRKVVNPEALTIGKERFEVRDDFVIVLRVLSKEEIQAYASATQVLRERRRNGEDGHKGRERDHDRDDDRDYDDDDGRRHRHHRHRDDDDGDAADREQERDRRRRHRRDEEDDYDSRARDQEHHHHHHRSHRD
ncbi:hypothetical protein HJFPF1_04940 [Paramyrothecium foliicola]|nr:hypothetical protein HJFPF1_04940 [Paramyrothecium foliicola]